MHILITGGAGFIGSHLVEHHLKKGDKVHVIDDLSTGSMDNVQPFLDRPDYRFDQADILLWDDLERATAWAERIHHLAAVVGMYRVLAEPIKVLATNVAGTERLLRAIRAGGWSPQFLFASTSEVYGSGAEGEMREGQALNVRSGSVTRWNYAISKLTGEALALSYAERYDLHVTIARLFNTIGPRQAGRYGMVVPRFVDQAVRGEPITVYGDGTQSRCFCDVRDTVRAFDLLLDTPGSKGEIVNVGNNQSISIYELAELVRRCAESSSAIKLLSYREAYGQDFEDIPQRRPSIEKLLGMTGLKYRYSLEDTLGELITWREAELAASLVAQEV